MTMTGEYAADERYSDNDECAAVGIPAANQWEVGPLDKEEDCVQFLFQLKWPAGFTCPYCAHRHAYTICGRRLPLYECASCGRQTSLIANTVMEGSRIPLTKWFAAIRLLSDPHQGISALRLRYILSVTYKTAWSMLRRIRLAMGRHLADTPLSGEVVLHDASYARPPFHSSIIPDSRENQLVVGASLSSLGEPKQLLIQVVSRRELVSEGRLLPSALKDFELDYVAPHAHVVQRLAKRYAPYRDKKAMPFVKAASRWLQVTFRGIGKKHLQSYFHEFCCRTNLQLSGASVFTGISRICACC